MYVNYCFFKRFAVMQGVFFVKKINQNLQFTTCQIAHYGIEFTY